MVIPCFNQTCSRGQKGVAIILSPEISKFYKLSGSKPFLTPDSEINEEYGIFIRLKWSIEVKSRFKGVFS